MEIYKNGDRCPCCGEALHDMSERELELFSQLCHALGLEKPGARDLEREDIDTALLDPPDAGIYPPVRPVGDR